MKLKRLYNNDFRGAAWIAYWQEQAQPEIITGICQLPDL